MITKEIYNSYEAAYYLSQGALLLDIIISKVPENHIGKKGYKEQWKMIIENINPKDIASWRNGIATANIMDIERERRRIKRFIRSKKYDR